MNSHLSSSLQEVQQILKTFVAQTDEKSIIGKHELKHLLELADELEEELEEKAKIIQHLRKKMDTVASSSSASPYELQDLKKKLELTQKEKDLLEEKAQQNNEALQLVREIVSAEYTHDSRTESADLYAAVDELANCVREELLNSPNTKLPATTKALLTEGLKEWTARAKKGWLCNKLVIAFIGGFSAGKTSIVNRILSQNDTNALRLPIETRPTTAYPTYICRGLSTYYNFLTPDNKQKELSAITFRRMKKEVLDSIEGISSLIKCVIVTSPNECLKNWSILDTPGIDSGDKEDKKYTIEVIDESDALFWVIDVNDGNIPDSSLKFVKEYIRKPIYVIVNKTDLKAPKDVDDVEREIQSTFKKKGINVQGYIRFSKKTPLEQLMTLIRGVKKTNTGDQYFDTIQSVMVELVQSCRLDLKEADMKRRELEKQINAICLDMEQGYTYIAERCDKILNLPVRTSPFVGDDYYKMSIGMYENNFRLGLSYIKDKGVGQIKNALVTYQDLFERWCETYDAYKDCRNRLGVLCRTQDKLNGYIKQYNKIKRKCYE